MIRPQEVDPLTCLQGKPLKEILASTDLLDKAAVWMPVPDSNFTSDPFLPGNPEDLMSNGEFNTDIEVIIGTTADEGILYLARTLLTGEWDEFKTRDTIIYFFEDRSLSRHKHSFFIQQVPFGALCSKKCSIKAPAKCKTPVYVFREICLQ